LNRIDKVPDAEDADIKEILQINLRSLKKTERPVHLNSEKNKKREPEIKMKDGLNSQEFKEKYTLYPYQNLFHIEKVDPKVREPEQKQAE